VDTHWVCASPAHASLHIPAAAEPRMCVQCAGALALLFVHDIAICMLMHVSLLIGLFAPVATMVVAGTVTFFVDHT
jgi:hypothetical protein